jgi:hypothetical protein
MEQFCAELEQLLADSKGMESSDMNFHRLKIDIMSLVESIKRNHVPMILRDKPNRLLHVSYDELKNIILGKKADVYYYLKRRYFTIINQFDIKIAIKNE